MLEHRLLPVDESPTYHLRRQDGLGLLINIPTQNTSKEVSYCSMDEILLMYIYIYTVKKKYIYIYVLYLYLGDVGLQGRGLGWGLV